MYSLLEAAIAQNPITNKMIENELYEICDRVHSSCGYDCPVYAKFGGIPLLPFNGIIDNLHYDTDCKCFKDGKKMLKLLRKGK